MYKFFMNENIHEFCGMAFKFESFIHEKLLVYSQIFCLRKFSGILPLCVERSSTYPHNTNTPLCVCVWWCEKCL